MSPCGVVLGQGGTGGQGLDHGEGVAVAEAGDDSGSGLGSGLEQWRQPGVVQSVHPMRELTVRAPGTESCFRHWGHRCG